MNKKKKNNLGTKGIDLADYKFKIEQYNINRRGTQKHVRDPKYGSE